MRIFVILFSLLFLSTNSFAAQTEPKPVTTSLKKRPSLASMTAEEAVNASKYTLLLYERLRGSNSDLSVRMKSFWEINDAKLKEEEKTTKS